MSEVSRISDEEYARRESYLRDPILPFTWFNPYTWAPHYRLSSAGLGMGLLLIYNYNRFMKRPFTVSLVPQFAVAMVSLGGVGFFWGKFQAHYRKLEAAYVDHYMNLHPEYYDQFKDRAGRPYSQILEPWYPRRGYYPKFDE
ncbi:hypothetical protein WR25_21751 [Diploscapter pachys]|uniref:NADH dehydrogenase [ubiquinone] 1 subunit C2 n=1 Tax=Diploscapter pachys TaxID=2018661 RepID=A0A2A2M1U8_9BILA|nr:hypothetical protein WR25_21751 [Diploscapter pachys]